MGGDVSGRPGHQAHRTATEGGPQHTTYTSRRKVEPIRRSGAPWVLGSNHQSSGTQASAKVNTAVIATRNYLWPGPTLWTLCVVFIPWQRLEYTSQNVGKFVSLLFSMLVHEELLYWMTTPADNNYTSKNKSCFPLSWSTENPYFHQIYMYMYTVYLVNYTCTYMYIQYGWYHCIQQFQLTRLHFAHFFRVSGLSPQEKQLSSCSDSNLYQ